MSKQDRIIYYLATGTQHARIAEIVGCTPSYVSQVAGDADAKDQIDRMKKEIAIQAQRDDTEEEYVKLETAVVANIKENLPFAEFADLTKLMDSLIRRKQQHAPIGNIVSNTQNNHITVLQVPASVLPGEIILNKQAEMIAVGNKSLAPMSTYSVKKLFEGLKKKPLPDFPEVDITDLKEMPSDF